MFPTLIKLGPLSLSSFGLGMAISITVGAFLVWRTARDRGVADEKILDNVVVTAVFTIFGARLLFVLTHFGLFLPNLLRTFLVWKFPGFSLWGGVLVGIAALVLFTRKQKLSLVVMGDAYGVALPWIMCIMSIAIFLDGTITGTVTNLLWGLPAVGVMGKRHPVALYSFLFSLISLAVVYLFYFLVTQKKVQRGSIALAAVVSFCLVQVGLALVRADLLYLAGFPVELVVSILFTLVSLASLSFKLELFKYAHEALNRLKQNYLKK